MEIQGELGRYNDSYDENAILCFSGTNIKGVENRNYFFYILNTFL